MADTVKRTFWIKPNGEIDPKTGKPKEYQQKPSTFILSGVGEATGLSSTPIQVTEEMAPDGEYVWYVDGPDGKPQELLRDVDQNKLALYQARSNAANRDADNARADAAARAAQQPRPQTPAEQAHTEAQTKLIEAQTAAMRPRTIERVIPTPGTNPALDDPRSRTTETVSVEQAAYDLKAVQAAEQAAHDRARLRMELERWTAEQAAAQYNKELDAIRTQLQRDMLAETRRAHDMQDATQRRGQDITLQGSRESDFMRLAGSTNEAVMHHSAPPEVWAAFDQGINDSRTHAGLPAIPAIQRPAAMDPLAFAAQARAMAQQPSPFVLPGGPPQQPSPYMMGQ